MNQSLSISDIAQVFNGKTPSVSDQRTNGHPVLKIKDTDALGNFKGKFESFVDQEYTEKYSEKKLRAGDFLILNAAHNASHVGSKVFYANSNLGEPLITGEWLVIRCNSSLVDSIYLSHYFSSDFAKKQLTGLVKGIHLYPKDVGRIKLKLPNISEQRRIGAILDKAEALRTKRRKAIAKLDRLLQSVFFEMFGDSVTNNKKWNEEKLLGEVADICSGITKGRKTTSETKSIPYLAVSNVQDRFLKLDVVKEIDATEDEIEKYKLKKNDLLLTEGGDPDKLGRGSLWHDEIPLCIHQNHVFRVRINNKEINPIYLNWLVGSPRGKRYFLSVAKQTTGIASINLGQLKRFPLLIPPLDLQEKFAKIEAAVREKHIVEQKVSLEKIDGLISSIQASYFQ